MFCFHGKQKQYLYRAVDQHGQVVDVLLRDKRDRASAEAFFRQAIARTGITPRILKGRTPYGAVLSNYVSLCPRIGP
ncbi:MAG: DDE-type integrase/transposase/recombinase [Deltaproteobacteria bacterium]|nr:DDE-type integrase/transposase/recombinase [Deltaproteobacteria bacterium]